MSIGDDVPVDQAKVDAIGAMMPVLSRRRHALMRDGHRLIGVVLPADLDPRLEPKDAATPAQIMRLPLTFTGTEAGLVVAL